MTKKEKKSKYQKKYKKKYPEKVKASAKATRKRRKVKRKDEALKYKFGISLKDYHKLLESQQNVCAICESPTPKRKKDGYFCVDHEKDTGRIRGLLCSPCNMGLGMFYDNFSFLAGAIRYLEKWKIKK